MKKEREIAELICEIIEELPKEKQEYYIIKWNDLLDKFQKEWKK